MATHDPSAASARIAGSRPGARSPASHLTTASSATVTATAGPRKPPAKTTTETTSSTTAAASQPTPVLWRWRGNGGGCPEGRRRRGERLIPACSSGPRAAAARAGGFAGTSITPPQPGRRPGRTTAPGKRDRRLPSLGTRPSQPLGRRPIHRSGPSVTVATDRRHRRHGDAGEDLRDAGAGRRRTPGATATPSSTSSQRSSAPPAPHHRRVSGHRAGRHPGRLHGPGPPLRAGAEIRGDRPEPHLPARASTRHAPI